VHSSRDTALLFQYCIVDMVGDPVSHMVHGCKEEVGTGIDQETGATIPLCRVGNTLVVDDLGAYKAERRRRPV
jgi:hypothetical protein